MNFWIIILLWINPGLLPCLQIHSSLLSQIRQAPLGSETNLMRSFIYPSEDSWRKWRRHHLRSIQLGALHPSKLCKKVLESCIFYLWQSEYLLKSPDICNPPSPVSTNLCSQRAKGLTRWPSNSIPKPLPLPRPSTPVLSKNIQCSAGVYMARTRRWEWFGKHKLLTTTVTMYYFLWHKMALVALLSVLQRVHS